MPIRIALLACALACVAPATALAAVPSVTTGGASGLSPSAATVSGSLNPNGRVTTWYFQYGKTNSYGARTVAQDAGSSTKRVHVSATLTGLTGKTTYHYRLVATNSSGSASGADKTFKTPEAPTVSTIAAAPNPVTFNHIVSVTGFLVGPRGGAGKRVALQRNLFPYTTGWAQVGNTVLTGPGGGYSFTLSALNLVPYVTAQLRVVDRSNPSIASAPMTLGVKPRVKLHVKRTSPSGVERFSGLVNPHASASAIVLQRRSGRAGWRKAAVMLPHHHSGSRVDTFLRHLRIHHTTSFRAVTRGRNGYVEGTSSTVRVKR